MVSEKCRTVNQRQIRPSNVFFCWHRLSWRFFQQVSIWCNGEVTCWHATCCWRSHQHHAVERAHRTSAWTRLCPLKFTSFKSRGQCMVCRAGHHAADHSSVIAESTKTWKRRWFKRSSLTGRTFIARSEKGRRCWRRRPGATLPTSKQLRWGKRPSVSVIFAIGLEVIGCWKKCSDQLIVLVLPCVLPISSDLFVWYVKVRTWKPQHKSSKSVRNTQSQYVDSASFVGGVLPRVLSFFRSRFAFCQDFCRNFNRVHLTLLAGYSQTRFWNRNCLLGIDSYVRYICDLWDIFELFTLN